MDCFDLYGLAHFLLPMLAEEPVIGRESSRRYLGGVQESPDLPPGAAFITYTGVLNCQNPTATFSKRPKQTNPTSHKTSTALFTGYCGNPVKTGTQPYRKGLP